MATKKSFRACQCWDMYRTGKCQDKLSNYMGYTDKIRPDSFRYFVRTAKNGAPMAGYEEGDTSAMLGHPQDILYQFDSTCTGSRLPSKEPEGPVTGR